MAKSHIDKTYEAELTALREQLLEMGGMVESAIAASVRAIIERDAALAEQVVRRDKIINRMEVDVDGACRRILPDWNQQMLATLAVDKAALPNYRSYVLPGASHTVIGDSGFYAAQSAGPTVASWLGAMLDPAGVDAWQHVACPDCLTPLPCAAQ